MSSRTIHTCAPVKTSERAEFIQVFLHYLAVRRQRQALARLDAHRLADIGITREEVEQETHRALWDAPEHWVQK